MTRHHSAGVPLLFGLVLGLGLVPAAPRAGPFVTDTSPIGQSTSTDVIIRGVAGESFTIAYVDAGGVARTKVVTLPSNLPLHTTVPAGKATTITITNNSQPAEPAQTEKSLALGPGPIQATTVLAMNQGSMLNLFGQPVALQGGFTTVATNVDSLPGSPGYGELSGRVPSSFFDVFFDIGGDQGQLLLDGIGPPFSLNVASVWDATVPDTGLSVPFTQALAGQILFQGSSTPFSGLIDGTVTFFPDNHETIAGSITLAGIGSGSFSASGRTTIPEPDSLALLGAGLLVLATAMSRRARRA